MHDRWPARWLEVEWVQGLDHVGDLAAPQAIQLQFHPLLGGDGLFAVYGVGHGPEMLGCAPRTDHPGGVRGDVGRKALVAGELTEAHSITLPASVWRRLEQIGGGNRSEGVRRLVEGQES